MKAIVIQTISIMDFGQLMNKLFVKCLVKIHVFPRKKTCFDDEKFALNENTQCVNFLHKHIALINFIPFMDGINLL
jgi:hypothetical protein